MGATLFRGATTIRGWMLEYLQATMPVLIQKAHVDWGIQPWQLPLPKVYNTYDPNATGLNQYPVVGAVFNNHTRHIRDDFTAAAEPEYWSNVGGSVFISVATPRNPDGDRLENPPYDSTVRVRDDMCELLRQAILVSPSLGQGPDTCWLEETLVNVNKHDPMKMGKDRPDYVANGVISVEYRVRNELWIPPFGTADTINMTIQKLPHPAEE